MPFFLPGSVSRMTETIVVLVLVLAGVGSGPLKGEPFDAKTLEVRYERDIQPLLARYCHECHGQDLAEAELNLAAISTWQDVRKNVRAFQKAAEMLDSRQMPPKDAEQPADADHKLLTDWVRDYLTLEIQARAGDPGKVVLRRLSNAEYTYTLRDLTGVSDLDPAREFPVDGAAGEGFTNTGNALVMSPALVTKYLDAAKEVARHAVLLPDGFRFSRYTTARDRTDDTLNKIRDFYSKFSESQGGDKVNLQGIVFQTNEGGRLPLEGYFTATLVEREALEKGSKTIDQVASERGLNRKYLATLWKALTEPEPSMLTGDLRARWRKSTPDDVPALVAYINQWQRALFRFTTVGHIGKIGGPKRWLEPVTPVVGRHELRFKLPPASDSKDIVISLVAKDAGDGNEHDFVQWSRPRLVAPGRPDMLLRDVRRITSGLAARRTEMTRRTIEYLRAAEEAASTPDLANITELAKKHQLDPVSLTGWLEYLGVGSSDVLNLEGHLDGKLSSAGGYDFVRGWGSHDTPLILANSSDSHVRVPGNMKAHSVAIHPSPALRAAVGWRSPSSMTVRLEGQVTHAHPECGNGVTWLLELRRGATRRRLASGIAHGTTSMPVGPVENIALREGDLVALSIGPRDRNHSCDLTQIDLRIIPSDSPEAKWDLAADVSPDILAGNPHADAAGRAGVWHFYTEKDEPASTSPVIPADSILAKWLNAPAGAAKNMLASQLQNLLESPTPPAPGTPDAELHRQLTSLGGPLLGGSRTIAAAANSSDNADPLVQSEFALDPASFGQHPAGGKIDAESLCVRAPNVIEVRLPAELVEGCELVTTGELDSQTGQEGSVQLEIRAGKVELDGALAPSAVTERVGAGQWTDFKRDVSFASPVVARENTESRKRIELAFDEFRQLFPPALCYTKIVPVDEVVTLTLFYREDDHLVRLMLDDNQHRELDRLWDELHFISRDALTLVDAFAQLMEFATQDADPKVFEPLRKPIHDRAEVFLRQLVEAEPKQLDALLAFADQAYRRPATESERNDLRQLYQNLRRQELSHDDAFRLTMARILVAPSFLYRLEKPGPGSQAAPVSSWELANRLSYFLWSSQPDDELRQLAASGRLSDPAVLFQQSRRMIGDDRTRRLAIEFGCQWLHINGFDKLDEKSEKHFPTFAGLRSAMFEESVQFFTDFFQHDRSVLNVLDADYTFLNGDLASHYGIPGIEGDQWRRVEGVKKYARGGILAQATTLATQSGASRTSPILRGNWVSEVLLGERLPRPPKGVPQLPDDESSTQGLTVRQLVEQHANDPKCSICHRKIDPLGFSLENFDAIGRLREKDLGDRPIDTRVSTIDGAEFEGLEGLQQYLLTKRKDAFVRQFCRKLLGYALGRAVQLSDQPLLDEMRNNLEANQYRVSSAIETIVQSRQFNNIRGFETAYEDE